MLQAVLRIVGVLSHKIGRVLCSFPEERVYENTSIFGCAVIRFILVMMALVSEAPTRVVELPVCGSVAEY